MVLDDPDLRDKYVSTYNVKAFTAEFDSVVDSIHGNRIDSWALVRGIADYADGSRNKQWQVSIACTRILCSNINGMFSKYYCI